VQLSPHERRQEPGDRPAVPNPFTGACERFSFIGADKASWSTCTPEQFDIAASRAVHLTRHLGIDTTETRE